MPRRRRKKRLRQFRCDTEGCKCEGRHWLKRAKECECRECEELAALIPAGEEVGVFVFQFNCECGHDYTVWCRWQDTAKCYNCKHPYNSPARIVPRRFIVPKSSRKHSCSRCHGRKNCPNLRERPFIVHRP